MLYYLAAFSDQISALNVFRYLTFRTGGAVMTALFISFVVGPRLIVWLKSKQGYGQPIREDGPESHLLTKVGTPTMGGVLILLSLALATILWADLSNQFVWAVLALTLGYGLIGFADDYLKVSRRNCKGLSGKKKLFWQTLLATVVIVWIVILGYDAQATNAGQPVFLDLVKATFNDPAGVSWSSLVTLSDHVAYTPATDLPIPFFKDATINLGWFYVIFALLVIVGSSNAVNLTDGLDGLAIVPVMIAAVVFMMIAYLAGNYVFATYLIIEWVPGTGELAVFCGAMIGAALGFLWFNAPPAQVFMGDTGSLALGGALGATAVATRHELVLAIVGGLFVLEAVSVFVQVISFKTTGKRVFRMAPLHHHFEKKGWAESTIVIRFWIIALILGIIGLSTLKLR